MDNNKYTILAKFDPSFKSVDCLLMPFEKVYEMAGFREVDTVNIDIRQVECISTLLLLYRMIGLFICMSGRLKSWNQNLAIINIWNIQI